MTPHTPPGTLPCPPAMQADDDHPVWGLLHDNALTPAEWAVLLTHDADGNGRTDLLDLVVAAVAPDVEPPQGETHWTLAADITPLPTQVPAGAAVLVPVASGTTGLHILPVQGGETEFPLWDVGGDHLGRDRTAGGFLPLTDEARRGGGVVLFLTPDSSLIHLRAAGPDLPAQPMRALPLAGVAAGDPRTLTPAQPSTSSFEVGIVPIAVGIGIDFESPHDNVDAQVRVSSPLETILDVGTACNGYLFPHHFSAHAPRGHPAHIAGTYAVQAETTYGATLEVQAYLITYSL